MAILVPSRPLNYIFDSFHCLTTHMQLFSKFYQLYLQNEYRILLHNTFTTPTQIQTTIISSLDYWHIPLNELYASSLVPLQSVINIAARMILLKCKPLYDSSQNPLRTSHIPIIKTKSLTVAQHEHYRTTLVSFLNIPSLTFYSRHTSFSTVPQITKYIPDYWYCIYLKYFPQ